MKVIPLSKERTWRRALWHTAKKHGMCLHAPEVRNYESQTEIEEDQRPAVKCGECGLDKVVAAVVFPKGISSELRQS